MVVNSNMYNSLRLFENQLQQYFKRYEKEFIFDEDIETQYDYRIKMLSYINDITIPNCVIKDIIQMICDIGVMDLKKLIEEINKNSFRVNHTEGKIKFHYIISIDDICEYMKNKMSNIDILTEPLVNLFSWCRSINGTMFYRQINNKMTKQLKLYEIVTELW